MQLLNILTGIILICFSMVLGFVLALVLSPCRYTLVRTSKTEKPE